MNRRYALAAMAAMVPAIAACSLPSLSPGKKAPSLAGVRWVKGHPARNLSDGKVHIVEFWATWCAPCRESMPHLSEIARKYAGRVEVDSIDVWEAHGPGDAKPIVVSFVKRQGSRMDYNVGVDSAGAEVTKKWLEVSGSSTIPTAFIINRRGRVAWIGPARWLDPALNAVLTGSQNPEHAVMAERAREDGLLQNLKQAATAGDLTDALTFRKRINDPDATCKGFELLKRADRASAIRYAQAVIDDPSAGMWDFLQMSWVIISPSENDHSTQDHDFAVKLVQTAMNRADPSDASHLACLEYLALAYVCCGNFAKAAETVQQSIDIMQADKTKDYREEIARDRKQLAAYRAGRASLRD